jgi:hypothetical protein
MFACRSSDLLQRRWIMASLLSVTVALGGCVTTSHVVGQLQGPTARVQTKVVGGKGYAADEPVSAEEAVGIDPCEEQLQNIEAALLLYYSLNRDLPQHLEDLVTLSSDDLPLTCPVSHQEYLYFKAGLPIPNSTRRIIVCDPTPAHQGKRWSIAMAPITPDAALELEPQKLPESVFSNLRPAR